MFVAKAKRGCLFEGWQRTENFACSFQLSQEFGFLQQPLITSQIKISIQQGKLKHLMAVVLLLEQ